MKFVTFQVLDSVAFGLAVGDQVVGFADLAAAAATPLPAELQSAEAYLAGLPGSFDAASALHATAVELAARGERGRFRSMADVKLLPPLRPAALIDFGLTPRHLVNSARVLFRHEFGPLLGGLAARVLARGIRKKASSPVLMYYKGNHLAIIGDGDEIGWPAYASYLDIEPELAFVTGGPEVPIAGYLIFNDASARDVQFPEMMGTGPARAKDFVGGNGLGPFLVTPDEIPDPLNLAVAAQIGERLTWRGHTSEITTHPTEVAAFLRTVYPPVAGIVVGLGTIPDTTSLDHDSWIRPGEQVAITIDGLGTLRQRLPSHPRVTSPSRWRPRADVPISA